jgi:short subunit dehydrogenase-like uncharacterized protein
MNRPYDIILFGATGFTGQLIARYLALHAAGEQIRWAVAGRNRTKLEQLELPAEGVAPGIIVADAADVESIRRMTEQTSVLMNAAGPFNWYGRQVVEACIHSKTHYLDITGEPSFVAGVYNDMFQNAQENGVCVVNCCGFDSIPADFAAWLTARQLPPDVPKSLRCFVSTNASFSGGTLTTAIQALHMEAQKKSLKTRLPRHPDAPRIALKIHFNRDMNAWAIPMPVVDPHIVRRSAFRLPADYGAAVGYGQFFLRSSFWKTVQMMVPLAAMVLLVRIPACRRWLFKKFSPGTGPDAARRTASQFVVTCIGKAGASRAQTVISGGDPGYDETAKMFGQAAFCMVEQMRAGKLKSGVLTPVEALGMLLVERLRREGLQIS